MREDVLGAGALIRLLTLLATASAVVGLLTACGNEGSGPEEEADAPQGVKTEERPTAPQPSQPGPPPTERSVEDRASSTNSKADEVENRIGKEMEEEQRQQGIDVTLAVCKDKMMVRSSPEEWAEFVRRWNAAIDAGDETERLRICDAAMANNSR